jgi:hypothetical protein
MGRGVGFAAAFEFKCELHIFFDLQEMQDVGSDCLAIEFIVVIASTLSRKIAEPSIVPFLHNKVSLIN